LKYGTLTTPITSEFTEEEVIKENKKYKMYGEVGGYLEEDKLSYKEKLEKIEKLCDKEAKNGDYGDKNVMFAFKLLKILQ